MRWLGFDWGTHLYHASDYFEQLYEWAVVLVKAGKAYVDELTAEQIREYRGTLTEPGTNSPWRDRPVEESLDLLDRMRKGEFPDGSRVLRAKIDMASGNINLRDPVMYRILHATHPRTGDAWCIYPTYDFAHGQSDAIEGITHSICTLEFEDHRPLYDWYVLNLPVPSRPRQYEFARLNLTHTVLSKRFLLRLVERRPRARLGRPAHADGVRPAPTRLPGRGAARLRGDDRRGQAGERRRIRGARALRARRAEPDRAAAHGRAAPAQGGHHELPRGAGRVVRRSSTTRRTTSAGTRPGPFSRELWIERDDFMEEPPKKFFRLAPGREVRLRGAYFVTCQEVVKDASGEVVELRCTYDPATRGGSAPDGRSPKATLHWVSAAGRRPGRGAALRPPLRATRPRAPTATCWRTSATVRRRSCRPVTSSRRSAASPPGRASSSSGSATSAPTPTRPPSGRSGTVSSPCATRGPRSARARASRHRPGDR